MVVKLNYCRFCSVIFNAFEISNPVLKHNENSKVLINFKNLYFFRVQRKDSLRLCVLSSVKYQLVELKRSSMCMDF